MHGSQRSHSTAPSMAWSSRMLVTDSALPSSDWPPENSLLQQSQIRTSSVIATTRCFLISSPPDSLPKFVYHIEASRKRLPAPTAFQFSLQFLPASLP